MNEVKYSTKEECIKAIETLKVIGAKPLPWMLDQLEKFEEAEKNKKVAYNSETPINLFSKKQGCCDLAVFPFKNSQIDS